MKVIVTCGPSYEPVDEVRRITNFSTGELGALLSVRLASEGADVVCLRGAAATHPAPAGTETRTFTTNDDLAARFCELADEGEVAAIFHAAALCDYRVMRITSADGVGIAGAKIASRSGGLTIHLEPATKIIRELRGWFPRSRIVGWKYELDGTPPDAIQKARSQILESDTDACVINGRAYGEGFGILSPSGEIEHVEDKKCLCEFLARWLELRSSERGNDSAMVAERLAPVA